MAHIMDKEHFYKVDGEFLLYASEITEALRTNNIFSLALASSKIAQKLSELKLIEIE